MNLYEIDAAVMACIDQETGEIIDPAQLDALVMEREQKIRNICLWMKNLKADITALKAEKEAFAARQKASENKLESLKQYLTGYLDGAPVKTTEFAVSFRKTKGTDITDMDIIPREYFIEQEPKLDKAGILAALKAGQEVPGCQIKETLAMTLK